MSEHSKAERLSFANQLIRIIGSHGRRFFYNKKTGEYARIELRNGRLWWIDDYKGTPVYLLRTGYGGRWRGFSHGGTMRSLVEDIRDYVRSGRQVPAWKIVERSRFADGARGNIWGYDEESAIAVRAAALALPIVAAE